MSYSFNAQSKGAKILLQSDREDYGTADNPTYMLGNVVKCPPGTFGFMGIEKLYFQQPPLFPSEYLNTTMSITYTPFSTNAANGATTFVYLGANVSLQSTDFSSTFTFDNIPYPVTLANIGYNGSGGVVLASYLDCFLTTLNSKVVKTGGAYNQCYPVFDFNCSLFTSWQALGNVSSTSSGISKADMASAWLRASGPPLSLFFKRTYVTTSYVTNHEIQTITVTLSDNNKSRGLLGRIFNLPTGTLTITQTSPNPTTNNAGFLAAVNASSDVAPLALNMGGINYIKVFCDMSQGFKAAHISLPGCLDTTLLGVIPVSGLPGSWEYYVSPATHERVALHGATVDSLTLWFTDESDRPLNAMNNYALVVGIDFVESEELAREPLMNRK